MNGGGKAVGGHVWWRRSRRQNNPFGFWVGHARDRAKRGSAGVQGHTSDGELEF